MAVETTQTRHIEVSAEIVVKATDEVATRGATRAGVDTAIAVPEGSRAGLTLGRLAARRQDILVVMGFMAFSIFVTWNLWQGPAGVVAWPYVGDPAQSQWFIAHSVRWVMHGENPFLTTRLNVPNGVNLMANTPILGLAVPMIPVTLVFGPAVTFVLLVTLALAGTASAWYFVLSRHMVSSRWAAVVGGGFCAFAPAMISHAAWHPNIIFQPLIPIIAWRAFKLLEGRPWRNGLILGLLVTYQVFINEEILLFAAMGIGTFGILYAAQRWREVLPRLMPFFAGLGVTVLVAGVLLAYPLSVQFFGPWHYTGLAKFHALFKLDLAGYFAYGSNSISKLPFRTRAGLAPNLAEENAFFGWGLMTVLPIAICLLWRNIMVRTLALTALPFMLLSLGFVIGWWTIPTGILGPWRVLNQLPLFDSVVPSRFGLVVTAVFGLLLAVLTDTMMKMSVEYGAVLRRGWGLTLAAVLLPIAPLPLAAAERSPVPRFVTGGGWRPYVAEGRSLLPVTSGGSANFMRWAAAANLDFAMPGGYFLYPQVGDVRNRGVQGVQPTSTERLLKSVMDTGVSVTATEDQRRAAVADLKYWRAAIVVLAAGDRNVAPLRSTLVSLLGAGATVDDVWLWDVRHVTGEEKNSNRGTDTSSPR